MHMWNKSRRHEIFDVICDIFEEYDIGNGERLYMDSDFSDFIMTKREIQNLRNAIYDEFGIDLTDELDNRHITSIDELIDAIEDGE